MQQKNKEKEIFKLLRYLKKYKFKIGVMVLLAISGAIVSAITPQIVERVIDDGLVKKNIRAVFVYVIIMIFLFLVEQVIEYIQLKEQILIKNDMETRLKNEAFSHLMKMKFIYFKQNGFVKIINDELYDIDNMLRVTDREFLNIFMEVFKTVGGAVGLFLINWKLALFLLLVVPFKYVLTIICSRKTQKIYVKNQQVNREYNLWLDDVSLGVQDIKLNTLSNRIRNEFDVFLRQMIGIKQKIIMLTYVRHSIDNCSNEVFIDFLYLLGGIFIASGFLSVGGVLAFISYSVYLLYPISAILGLKTIVASIIPSIKGHEEFMSLDEEREGKRCVIEHIESIEFKQVCLGINGEQILDKVSFEIKRGEKVALLGANGSGKTSIVNLLLGLYEPENGEILINGINIENIDIEQNREIFAVVAQNVHLFNKTILQNIFLENGIKKDIYYFEKLKKNQLFCFIEKFPENWKTLVGIGGNKLSGGERQKIVLMRELVSNGKVLVLDEATSSYDLVSEKMFNDLVLECNKFDCEIIITHRDSILEQMDKIIVLDKGKIYRVGTYKEIYGGK